jgi:hypothetical protein
MNPPQTQTSDPRFLEGGNASGTVANGAPTYVTQLPPSHLQICDSCDAPLDALQRYCLNCGTRSRYTRNPAVEFLASKHKPSRLTPKSAVVDRGIGGTGVTKNALPWLVGATIAALAIGAYFGNSGSSDNAKLAAAIANQKAPVINVGGGGGATTATAAAVTPLTSDFTLSEGYTIQLQTIPQAGSDQAAVDAAKAAATAKGASTVAFINPADHAVTPDPGATNYVIVSGAFKKKGDAAAALKQLKAKFPAASVVSVKAAGGADADGAVLSTGTNGKAAHSLKSYKPSAKKQSADKKSVDDLADKKGQAYRDAQNKLPAEVTVPGDPNAAPALPDPAAPQP